MENKNFTKADLKVGYVVKFRRGDLRMIMPTHRGTLIAIGSDGTNGELYKYEDNLLHSYGLINSNTFQNFSGLDIMEVYGFSHWDHKAYHISAENRDLLWKREEPKKMTVEEIEKELGYSPEELKKIIDEYKRYKERSLYISSAINMTYGSLGSPFRKKLEEMREAAERRKRWEDIFKEIGFPEVESLYPKIMIGEKMGGLAVLGEWTKKQVPKANPDRGLSAALSRPVIKDVIFNDPATIVFWKDGTKTVVKAQGEAFDPEKGLAMAFSKKMFGNDRDYYIQFLRWLKKAKKGAERKELNYADNSDS